MIITPEAWSQAGGSADRFSLYAAIGTARGFATETGRCLATLHPALPTVGAVGDWVGDDHARLQAEAWLASQGCTVLRGPMELCTHFAYRANLGPHDIPAFFTEPSEAGLRWTDAGYSPVAGFSSELGIAGDIQRNGARVDTSLREAGWTLEVWGSGGPGSIDEQTYRAGVSLVHRLTAITFTEAYGYAPVPEFALQAVYAPLRGLVDPRLVVFARAPDTSIGGFFFGLPDAAVPGRFLLKTLAVDPAHRRKGLGAWLSGELYRSALDAGYTTGLHVLIADTSHSLKISNHGGTPFRRYALYEKPA